MKLRTICLSVMFIFLTGCMAMQPVKWKDTRTVNTIKISTLEIETLVDVPEHELEFMRTDIKNRLSHAQFWSEEPSEYTLKVTIDTYEEGNAFARAILIGLGQMHLNGSVELLAGDPPKVVKSGYFEKNYVAGGIAGATATMHKDVVVKLGSAIIEALKHPSKKES